MICNEKMHLKLTLRCFYDDSYNQCHETIMSIWFCGNYMPLIRMNNYQVRIYGIYGIFMQHENYLQERI